MRNDLGNVTRMRHMVSLYSQQPCMTSVPIILMRWHKNKAIALRWSGCLFLSCSSILKQVAWLPPRSTALYIRRHFVSKSHGSCTSLRFTFLHFFFEVCYFDFPPIFGLTWIDLFSRPISIHRGDWSMDICLWYLLDRWLLKQMERSGAHFFIHDFSPDSYRRKRGIVISHQVKEIEIWL